MKSLLIFCINILLAYTCIATTPPIAYMYEQHSEGKSAYFRSIPYSKHVYGIGKTIAFDSNKRQLYTIEEYFYRHAFINNSGETFISFNTRVEDAMDTTAIITVLKNGAVARKYTYSELFPGHSMPNNGRRYGWYRKSYMHQDTLFVLCNRNDVLFMDINTGSMIGRGEKKALVQTHNTLAISYPEQIFLAYPEPVISKNPPFWGYYFIPDLKDGQSFHTAFIDMLKVQEAKTYEEADLFVNIHLIVERDGTTKVHDIRYEDEKPFTTQQKQKMEKWLNSLQLKPGHVPKECEKWVFEEFFYLKQ